MKIKPILELEKLKKEITVGIIIGFKYDMNKIERFYGIEIFLFGYALSVGFIRKI